MLFRPIAPGLLSILAGEAYAQMWPSCHRDVGNLHRGRRSLCLCCQLHTWAHVMQSALCSIVVHRLSNTDCLVQFHRVSCCSSATQRTLEIFTSGEAQIDVHRALEGWWRVWLPHAWRAGPLGGCSIGWPPGSCADKAEAHQALLGECSLVDTDGHCTLPKHA